MPVLFLLFTALVIRSLTLSGAMEGVQFSLSPNWSYLNRKTVLTALAQAFFDFADFSTSSIVMPLEVLFIALFVGVKMKKSDVYEEVLRWSNIGNGLFDVWYVPVKRAAPAAIMFVFLQSVGMFR